MTEMELATKEHVEATLKMKVKKTQKVVATAFANIRDDADAKDHAGSVASAFADELASVFAAVSANDAAEAGAEEQRCYIMRVPFVALVRVHTVPLSSSACLFF